LNVLFPNTCFLLISYLNDYSPEDIATLEAVLVRLREAVIAARSDGSEKLDDETNE